MVSEVNAAPPTILLVAGTRPEVIKLAPLYLSLRESSRLLPHWASVQQHADLLGDAIVAFSIRPDSVCDIQRESSSLNELASLVLRTTDRLIDRVNPAGIVVQGDTTTAAMASIAAFNRQVPVVHLEAGLRSGDLASPFPEEANRRLISSIAGLHLAPTRGAVENLKREGVPDHSIALTGNTVTDAARIVAEGLEVMDLSPRDGGEFAGLVLVTAHRRESWGAGLSAIARAVGELAVKFPNVCFFWPIHPNPIVRSSVEPLVGELENVRLTGPLAYPELVRALSSSCLVITDSGGIQEEAPTFGVPVLVAREVTERMEGIDAGTAVLVGTDKDRIVEAASDFISDPGARERVAQIPNPYGDGFAANAATGAIELFILGYAAG